MRTFPNPTPPFAGSPNKGAYQAQHNSRVAHQNMLKHGGRKRGGSAVAVPQFGSSNNANNLVVKAAGHQLNADNLNNSMANTGKPKTGGRRKKRRRTRKFKFFFS